MNLDNLIDEKNIIEDSTIEDIEKEEIKENGTKSIGSTAVNYSNLKQMLIDYYSGGSDISFIEVTSLTRSGTSYQPNSWVNTVYFTITDSSSVQKAYTLNNSPNMGTLGYESEVIYNRNCYRIHLLSADDDCIGLDLITANTYNETNASFEIIPKTGQSIDNPTVSGNSIDYTEYLETIIERLEGIEEDVQSISNNIISAGNGSNNNNNSEIGSVSQNILTTPINEYGLTDSLLFVGLGVAFVTLVIVVVRRLIYRWN